MNSKLFHPVVRPVAGLAILLAATSFVSGQSTSVVLNASPTRVVGHVKLNQLTAAPNLVEGRELNGPQSVAVDTSVTPPILYVADTFNNRVLAFKNATALSKANVADRVIGQRDLLTTNPQGPTTGLSTGLSSPCAVAVDKNGNLYVMDTGNHRILRYPKPLTQTGDLLPVDLVIGQRAVQSGSLPNQGNQLPSAKTLFLSASQYLSSMAFDPQGNLWVTDTSNNRVLRYPAQNLSVGITEPSADVVIGQNDFTTRTQPTPPPNVAGTLFKGSAVAPSGIAIDSLGRMYVADAFQRVLFYTPPFNSGAFASRILREISSSKFSRAPPRTMRPSAA